MTVSVAARSASSNTLSAGLPNAAATGKTLLDHPEYSLDVVIPEASAAKDDSLVLAVVRLTNAAFVEAEAGIWNEGYDRTAPDEVAKMLRGRQLALCYLSAGARTASPTPSAGEYHYTDPEGQQLVGCACVKQQSPTAGFVGMLAVDRKYQGLGLARHLMEFAEKRFLELGCSTAELDLIYPTAFVHTFKARMNAWYLRLGYELVQVSSFEEKYPDFAPLLAGPVESRIFEKRLC